MTKKKLPQSLVEKQERTRNNTIEIVTSAIVELEAQGYSIKIRDLMEVTGLSRSVFAKPHIRKVLVEYCISKPAWVESPPTSKRKPRDIATLLAEKDGYIQRLLTENEQMKYEIELLRGKIHLLMHKVAAAGGDIY